MANIKITDLNNFADPNSTDVLPIVDVAEDETKRVSIGNLMKSAFAGTAALPGVAFAVDEDTGMYRNASDQLAFATGGVERILIDDNGDVTISGSLTVNGTTTTIDSTTLTVEDKNIELGVVDTPSDATADGGGITLKGATDKTLNWVNSTDSWTSSENVDLASGKTYKIAGTDVLSGSTLGSGVTGSSLTSVGTITTGVWNGTALTADAIGADAINGDKIADDSIDSEHYVDGSIDNVHVSASAAIAGTKISADFGAQDLTVDTNVLHVDATNDRVGVGTTSPTQLLHVAGDIRYTGDLFAPNGSNTAASIRFFDANSGLYHAGSDALGLITGGTEKARIDSDGRLLVGVNTAPSGQQVQAANTGGENFGAFRFSANTGPCDIALHKSRGSLGNHSIVSSGDSVGSLAFRGSDGSAYVNAASINAVVDGTPAASDMPGRLVFSTNPGGGTSVTERMRISANGNITVDTDTFFVDAVNDRVGIGTTSPDDRLHISGSNAGGFRLTNADNSDAITVFMRGGNGIANTTDDAVLSLGQRSDVSLITTGNVGIGTTSPSNQLHVRNSANSGSGTDNCDIVIESVNRNASLNLIARSTNGSNIFFGDGDSASRGRIVYEHSTDGLLFGTSDSGENVRIDSSGRLLVGTSTARDDFFNTSIGGLLQVETSETGTRGVTITNTVNSDASSLLVLAKSRGTSVGANGVVSNGDHLATLSFQGDDGSELVEAARIAAYVDGTPGANDMPGRLEFHTTKNGESSPTQRMSITQAGRVLIGTNTETGAAIGNGVIIKANAVGSAYNTGALSLTGTGGDFYSLTFNKNGTTSDEGFGFLSIFSTTDHYCLFGYNDGSTNTSIWRGWENGNFQVIGALSKASGSFRIDHPLEEKRDTHDLVHSFIEGPQADLIYRGHTQLVNGTATINIDQAARMTEGTFEALCTNVSCFTSNESDWTAVRGSVTGNILTIEAQDSTSTAEVSWMVVGERKDPHMIETNWTDENGRVITEPLKEAQ